MTTKTSTPLSFDDALASCRKAGATSFLSYDDASMQADRARAWADDLLGAGMITADVHGRLVEATQAGSDDDAEPAPRVRFNKPLISPLPHRYTANEKLAPIVRAALAAIDVPADIEEAWHQAESEIDRAAFMALRKMQKYLDRLGTENPFVAYEVVEPLQYHAQLLDIEAIGPIGEGWHLRPFASGCYDLSEEGADEGLLRVPAELEAEAYRCVIRAYELGKQAGRADVQGELRRTLGVDA